MLKKLLWLFACVASANVTVSAQDVRTQQTPPMHSTRVQSASMQSEVIFRFVVGKDMFFSPWKENGDNLRSLCNFIDAHHEAIITGKIPVHVYGYCASEGNSEARRKRVRLMSNRVKSELILRNRLSEECFRTQNSTEASEELRNTVVVRISVTPDENIVETSQDAGQDSVETVPTVPAAMYADDNNAAPATMEDASDVHVIAEESSDTSLCITEPSGIPATELRHWHIGLNVGIPFFGGDMVTMASGKTYIGFAVGIQGSYRISELLSAGVSVDYARGRAGARGYSRNYQLSPNGMTLYWHGTDSSLPYGELYSRISLVNVGLGVDVNVNRLFSRNAAAHRFTVWMSPTVYGQFFNTDIYKQADDVRFSDGSTKPAALSLGLGGSVSLLYRLSEAFGLQLKNSVVWLTDNKFDGIVTPYGHTRHNLMWLPQVGVVFMLR